MYVGAKIHLWAVVAIVVLVVYVAGLKEIPDDWLEKPSGKQKYKNRTCRVVVVMFAT